MVNYILMHGAWHWGGCFQKVATELAVLGHRVATPDLASHGFDSTPAQEVASIAQYTAPARRLIEASDEPVILLGHSMGGVSATYLAELLAPKIAAVVYLAAFMAPGGKLVTDYLPSVPGVASDQATGLLSLVVAEGSCLRLNMQDPEKVRAGFYHDCSDHDFMIARNNMCALQPVPDIFTPSVTTAANYGSLRRVYIECTGDQAIPIAAQRQMQADQPGTEVFSMEASHSPFFSQPEKLAAILASLA
jgi:pimeloyl-ACP methyl ester carboxylesterase